MTLPWLMTARGRREMWAVGATAALLFMVPLFTTDLFPFSRAPMFADSPRCYCDYELYDAEGQRLDNRTYGLHRVYWGNPLGEGVGFMPAKTLDRFGEVPDADAVMEHVTNRLKDRKEPGEFLIVQKVIGPLGDGVGTIERRELRVRVSE